MTILYLLQRKLKRKCKVFKFFLLRVARVASNGGSNLFKSPRERLPQSHGQSLYGLAAMLLSEREPEQILVFWYPLCVVGVLFNARQPFLVFVPLSQKSLPQLVTLTWNLRSKAMPSVWFVVTSLSAPQLIKSRLLSSCSSTPQIYMGLPHNRECFSSIFYLSSILCQVLMDHAAMPREHPFNNCFNSYCSSLIVVIWRFLLRAFCVCKTLLISSICLKLGGGRCLIKTTQKLHKDRSTNFHPLCYWGFVVAKTVWPMCSKQYKATKHLKFKEPGSEEQSVPRSWRPPKDFLISNRLTDAEFVWTTTAYGCVWMLVVIRLL